MDEKKSISQMGWLQDFITGDAKEFQGSRRKRMPATIIED